MGGLGFRVQGTCCVGCGVAEEVQCWAGWWAPGVGMPLPHVPVCPRICVPVWGGRGGAVLGGYPAFRVCLCASVPLCLCLQAFVPLCLCASVSLCLCASVFTSICASVPLCLQTFVPLCLCATVYPSICVSVLSVLPPPCQLCALLRLLGPTVSRCLSLPCMREEWEQLLHEMELREFISRSRCV